MQISLVFCSETTYTISTEPKRTEQTGRSHRNPHLYQKVIGGSHTPPVPTNLHNRPTPGLDDSEDFHNRSTPGMNDCESSQSSNPGVGRL